MNLSAVALFVASAASPAELPVQDPTPPVLPEPPGPSQSEDPLGPPSSRCPTRDPASPDSTQDARQARAREAIARADASFQQGRYDEALAEVARAECEAPHRDYTFMRGAIHQSRGDCEAAVAAYESFLDQSPPAIDASAAKAAIRGCQGQSQSRDQRPSLETLPIVFDSPSPPPPRTEPDWRPPPDPVEPPPAPQHWSRDVPGGVMMGVGLVGMGIGTALLVAERQDNRTPEQFDDFVRYGDERERLRTAGTAVLSVSAGVVLSAAIRYVLVARRGNAASREVARR